jgi:hypothetical protein
MSNTVVRWLTNTLALVVTVGVDLWGVQWSTSVAWSVCTAVADLDGTADRLVEQVVVLLCAATLTLVLVWLLVSLLVCSVDAARRGAARPATRSGSAVAPADDGGFFRPRLVRTLVSAVAGVAVVTGSAAAAAPRSDTSPLPDRLAGLTLPDRPYGGVRTHRVEAGESLWSITADLLPTDRVTDRAIRRAWPGLHQLNRDRLGRDPDLIHPGTTLRLPVWATVPTRGATR